MVEGEGDTVKRVVLISYDDHGPNALGMGGANCSPSISNRDLVSGLELGSEQRGHWRSPPSKKWIFGNIEAGKRRFAISSM
jgi:hypothetical protein